MFGRRIKRRDVRAGDIVQTREGLRFIYQGSHKFVLLQWRSGALASAIAGSEDVFTGRVVDGPFRLISKGVKD